MAESHNRTLICSVLFIDIVEYSRKPVVEQIALKDRFNELLSEALRGIAVNDRIILDTGDGAAISFIGDPEDALFVAAGLRDTIAKEAEEIDLELATRMGINLGPVRLVKDINGQPNIIGDGINVAQRVMSFAKPFQILVSRSYYEVVSRLSDESAKLFTYEGSRTDKHIREHEVYGVGDISLLTRHVDEKSSAAESGIAGRVGAVSNAAKSALGRIGAKPRVATSAAVVVILAFALSARMLRHEPASVTAAAADAPAREAQAQTAPVEPSPPSPSPVQLKKSAHVAQSDQSAASSTPKSASAQSAKKRVQVAAVQDTRRAAPEEKKPVEKAPEPAQPSGEPATVTLAISPWGQIFVNGQMRGVSPPLQQLELPPGKHRIEVKNSGAQTHVVSLNAKAGERLRIKYKFE